MVILIIISAKSIYLQKISDKGANKTKTSKRTEVIVNFVNRANKVKKVDKIS